MRPEALDAQATADAEARRADRARTVLAARVPVMQARVGAKARRRAARLVAGPAARLAEMHAGTAVRPVTAGTVMTVGQAARVQTVRAAVSVPAAALVLKGVPRTAPVAVTAAGLAGLASPSGPSAPPHREVPEPAAISGAEAARE